MRSKNLVFKKNTSMFEKYIHSKKLLYKNNKKKYNKKIIITRDTHIKAH